MNDLQCVECLAGANCTGTRKPATRGASNWLGLAGRMVLQRLIGEGIELARPNVVLELAVPCSPVKRKEPVTEFCQFLRG
jgi:hypothetical protein